MSKIKIVVSIMLISLLQSTSMFAQDEADEIRQIVKEFHKTSSKFRTEGFTAAEDLLKFVSTNFTLDGTSINIKNVVSREKWNYKETVARLNRSRGNKLTLKRTIRNLDQVYVRDNLAYARYENDYEWYEGERLISKGIQFSDVIFKKYPEKGWLIESFNFLDADNMQYKGMCISEIYETKGNDEILTRTLVPDGTVMDQFDDQFKIHTDFEPKLVQHAYKDYLWTQTGAVFHKKRDGSQGTQIGNAKTKEKMVLLLLQKEVYPDGCFNVVPMLK